MPVYDTPYYGTRRKALTGMGYGPYYGMSLTGGEVLPTEGRRALPAEISDKYQATGTPAITGDGAWEGGTSAPMEGEFDAATAHAIGAMYGIPGAKSDALRGPSSPAWGVATAAARTGASYLGGPLLGTFTSVATKVIGALMATAFPSLSTPSPLGGIPSFEFSPARGQFAVDRSIAPLSQTAAFTGLNTSDIFGVFSDASLATPFGQAAALAALGSNAQLGSIEASLEGWGGGFGVGGFSGGTDTGFGAGEGGGNDPSGW